MGRWGSKVMVTLMAITLAVGRQPMVRIVLREKVSVAGSTVRLGEIAEVKALTGEDKKLLTALQQLPVAPSPLPRYQRIITAGEVATKLAQAGWLNGDFVLDGAKQVVVTRGGRMLKAADLERLLQKALKVPVKLLLPPPPVTVPDGEVRVQTETPSSHRSLLPVTLLVNGQPATTLKVLAQVGSEEPSAISHQSPLTSRQSPFATVLVRRLQTVRLVACVGRVVVKAHGTALQEGKLGDEVAVAVPWSKSPLRGVVTGEREVTIVVW